MGKISRKTRRRIFVGWLIGGNLVIMALILYLTAGMDYETKQLFHWVGAMGMTLYTGAMIFSWERQ